MQLICWYCLRYSYFVMHVCMQTNSNSSSACRSAALYINLCILPKQCFAETAILIMMKSHWIHDMFWFPVLQWYCILKALWSVQWHLYSQATVKTHTEVGFKTWQLRNMLVMDIAGIHMSLDCCWTKQQDISQFPAHMLYCSRIIFLQHVWMFLNIESKTKDQLTDSQIHGPFKIAVD